MIKLSEERVSKAKKGLNLGFLHQTVSQVLNTKEKFLEEIKCSTPVTTQMIKWNRLADMEKVLMVWLEKSN